MSKRKTLEQFIEEAKKIHRNKYDYSLVDYKNAITKVKIICKQCKNIFEQTPNLHLSGNRCPICYGTPKKTINQFIKDAKKIHGDKYDYSLVDYKNNKTKIKIVCPIHGIFEQTPNSHLNGSGCLFCSGKFKKTTEQFIKDAKKIHGDKYDYSLVDYKNDGTKVKIKCNTCGKIFEQTPNNHFKYGCPYCNGNTKKTTEQFIKDAKKIHGDKYDYSLVDYKNAIAKVKIICPIHGIFEQSPRNHLNRKGCPRCCESHGEKEIANYLTENNIVFEKEKKFKNCKYITDLRFDFYLPNCNTCIEYDGIQHFKAVKRFGGANNLKNIQKRDHIKTDYCLKNHVRLIRVKYTENINNILDLYNLM